MLCEIGGWCFGYWGVCIHSSVRLGGWCFICWGTRVWKKVKTIHSADSMSVLTWGENWQLLSPSGPFAGLCEFSLVQTQTNVEICIFQYEDQFQICGIPNNGNHHKMSENKFVYIDLYLPVQRQWLYMSTQIKPLFYMLQLKLIKYILFDCLKTSVVKIYTLCVDIYCVYACVSLNWEGIKTLGIVWQHKGIQQRQGTIGSLSSIAFSTLNLLYRMFQMDSPCLQFL